MDPAAWSPIEWSVFLNEYTAHRESLRSIRGGAETPRQLAAAALDRLALCHDAICDLHHGRSGLFSGLLVRHAFECWVVGLYLCLEGDDAVRHLGAADARALRILARERPDAGWAEEAAAYDGQPDQRLGIEEIAIRVGKELRRRNHPPLDPRRDYQAMYRAESRAAVHAGVGSLVRHLEGNDDELWLATTRPRGLEDEVAQTWTLTYAAHLGGFVFEAFGLSREVMDSVFWRCMQLFEADDDPELD
jgi:hypothetical protein